MLRVQPNHGLDIGGGASLRGDLRASWTGGRLSPRRSRSIGRNNSWIGGSPRRGKMCSKSSRLGRPVDTSMFLSANCSLRVLRVDTFCCRSLKPTAAQALDQSLSVNNVAMTCQSACITSSQLIVPCSVAPLSRWSSLPSCRLYDKNKWVSHGCNAHVIMRGITQIHRSTCEATRSVSGWICTLWASRYNMKRCVGW